MSRKRFRERYEPKRTEKPEATQLGDWILSWRRPESPKKDQKGRCQSQLCFYRYTPQVENGTQNWWFPKKTSYSRVTFSSSILNFGTVLFHFLLTSKWSTIISRSQGAIRNHPKDMRQHLPCFHSLWKKSMITTSWWLNHPSEKDACQIGSFPQVGVQNNIWNHHLDKISP